MCICWLVLVVMGRVCASVCYMCLWMGELKKKKMTFLKMPSKTQLSVESKSLGLPVSERPYGLGLKSFRVLHSSFSVYILLASHQINNRFLLTSKSNQPNLLFTEITLRDLTWSNQLMRIMCFKIRLTEKLGSEGVFHALPLAGMSSPCFSVWHTLICSPRLI